MDSAEVPVPAKGLEPFEGGRIVGQVTALRHAERVVIARRLLTREDETPELPEDALGQLAFKLPLRRRDWRLSQGRQVAEDRPAVAARAFDLPRCVRTLGFFYGSSGRVEQLRQMNSSPFAEVL